MKIIITEEQEKNLRIYKIYELVKPYFEEKGFNNLEKVIMNDNVYYINKDTRNILFYYNQGGKKGNVYINHTLLWKFFESYFSLQYKEVQEVIKYWLEDFYKLKGLTPENSLVAKISQLDEAYKLKGLTPANRMLGKRAKLDEAYKLKGLTPLHSTQPPLKKLDEAYKLKGLTPHISRH